MTIKIHGRDYKTVATRVTELHASNQASVTTELVHFTDSEYIIKATVTAYGERDLTYTGHAHERQTAKGINSTSALENCETSAIGRALAAAGFAGEEFASADEVANAIGQQNSGGPTCSASQVAEIEALIDEVGVDRQKVLAWLKIDSFEDLAASRFAATIKALEAKR